MDAELDSLRCFAGPPLVDMFMEHFGFTQAEAEQATADFRVRYEPTPDCTNAAFFQASRSCSRRCGRTAL